MCNCNQKRAIYKSDKAFSRQGMKKVTLTENKPIVIHGDFTGRTYLFERVGEIIWVDNRDAISLEKVIQLQVI